MQGRDTNNNKNREYVMQNELSEPSLTTLLDEEEILFRSNGVLTLGVEVELQLIDASTYNLCSRAEEVLNRTSHIKKIKPEFYLSTIEINTDKCG